MAVWEDAADQQEDSSSLVTHISWVQKSRASHASRIPGGLLCALLPLLLYTQGQLGLGGVTEPYQGLISYCPLPPPFLFIF